MADYRRLSCPSCGRSYKYRGGLLRHIAECFSDAEKNAVSSSSGNTNDSSKNSEGVGKNPYQFWKP